MPHFPTRSNLMRSPRTANTPPICKSKDKIVGIITRCRCPACDECEDTAYTEITFDEFEEILDAETDSCGSWFWEGDEDSPQATGDWNNCVPPGPGSALATIRNCAFVFLFSLNEPSITYPDWLALLVNCTPDPHVWEGEWTSSDTGNTTTTNGDNCA